MSSKEKPIISLDKDEDLARPETSNTYRVGFSENSFVIDFGFMTETETERAVKVVTRVALPPNSVNRLILSLFVAGEKYEKKFNKDIGFSKSKQESGKEE